LKKQSLTESRLQRPEEVVACLGAVQAQDYAGAKWAVAQRTIDCTDSQVEQACADGSILRTHVLRPTWHFVTPADIRWMLELTARRIKQVMSYSNRKFEFHPPVLKRAGKVLARALRDGRSMIRSEMYDTLTRAGINVAGDQRLGHLLMDAELDGVICSGPRRGNQATYMLLDERAPAAARLDRDEALLRLARIYFTSHGPATPSDFSWWSGLTVADAKRGIEIAGNDLEKVLVSGRAFFGSPDMLDCSRSGARLLPNYDEFFIAYRDRSAVAQRLRKSGFNARTDNIFSNIAIVDGQVVGTWRRAVARSGVRLELTPLVMLTEADRKKLRSAARRYSMFLRSPVELLERSLYQSS
jgi:hypothetical protein